MKNKQPKFDMWTILGKYYGYPQCCIDSFRKLEHVFGESRKLTGTGYIPCLKCNKKSVENLILSIQKKRICSLPFPEETECEIQSHEIMVSAKFSLEEKEHFIGL